MAVDGEPAQEFKTDFGSSFSFELKKSEGKSLSSR